MVSNAMRQLEERHMATKVDLVVWSNKMDLLALSNAKGYFICTTFNVMQFCDNQQFNMINIYFR
jgi:hypothetical protein